MNGNIEDDPWSSGWNDDNDNNNNNTSINDPLTGATATTTPYQSSYLTSSQLFTSTGGGGGSDSGGGYNSGVNTYNSTIPPNLINVPSSYETIYSHFITKYNNNNNNNNSNSTFTLNDFEINIIDKLISLNYLTNYQKQKILDIIYENNLLPINQSFKFYQILGLLALEIDVPGTGDYVTLQFRLNNNLPDLPEKFVNEITQEEEKEEDNGLLGNRNRLIQSHSGSGGNKDDWNIDDSTISGGNIGDPLLVDHSHIHDDSIDENNSINHSQQQSQSQSQQEVVVAPNVDSSYIEKYINDIKDQFKPLFSGIDLIKIKEVPEKEGIIFKHINYMITHDLKIGGTSSGTKKVIRRYSDFVWYVKLLLNKANFYESLYVLLTIFI